MQRWQDGDNGDDGSGDASHRRLILWKMQFSVMHATWWPVVVPQKMLIGPRFGDYVTVQRRISRIVPGPMKYFISSFSQVEDVRQEVQTVGPGCKLVNGSAA